MGQRESSDAFIDFLMPYYSVLLPLLLLLLELMINEGSIQAFLPPPPIKPHNPLLLSRGLWEAQITVSSTTAAFNSRVMMIDGGLRAAIAKDGLSVNDNINNDAPPEIMNDVASIERLSVDELDEALYKMGINLEGHGRAKKIITLVQALGLGNKSKCITPPRRPMLLDDDSNEEEDTKILADELEPRQEAVPVATGEGISDHLHFAPPRGLTSIDKEHTEAILSTRSEEVLQGSSSNSSSSSELDERLVRERTTIDVLLRQDMKFTTTDGSEVDAYIVSTKRGAREWEGEFKNTDETHVVIVMSDSFGYKDPNTRAVADEVAFICDTVVAVPDLFRGQPWIGNSTKDHHHAPADYESWRVNCANEERAIADAASCALYMQAEYQPASMGFFGMCYGGGRALELAAIAAKERNELLLSSSNDKTQKDTQPKCITNPANNRNSSKSLFAKVAPDCIVVFYPTWYDPKMVSMHVACPIMAMFAANDKLPGARPEDATKLQQGLEANPQVIDYLLRSFEGEDNGFSHRGVTVSNNNNPRDAATIADDTMLLATVWFDLYLQKKKKTTGIPVRLGLESSLGLSS